MSLFVHPENQKILWNIINGNPFIIRYFENKPPQTKELWFKQSIEDFYTRVQGKHIDPNELNNLNKEALTSMIQSVHLQNPQYTAHNSSQYTPQQEHVSTPQQYSTTNEPMNMMTHSNTINTPGIVKDNKEDIFNKQFQMRQQEYDTMLQRKIPNEIDFREKSSDEHKDINELLERERKEREELMKPIQQTNKLSIDSTNSNNITLEAIELQESKEKKSVSWNTETSKDNWSELFEVQKSEMYSMRLHIIELSKQLEETKTRLINIETQLQENNRNKIPTKEENKPQHHISKYANLEENTKSNKITDDTVLVEDVNTDSDS
jgi:hypothetical protein